MDRRHELHFRRRRNARASGRTTRHGRAVASGLFGTCRAAFHWTSMNFSLSPEQESYLAKVTAFARERVAPAAARIDESAEYPRALVSEAAALGLMGATIPRESGGAGQDYLTYCMAIEAVSLASA